jgi:hypothetical protein
MMLEHQCSANFRRGSRPSFVIHALSRVIVAARGRTQGSPLRGYRDGLSNFDFRRKPNPSRENTVQDSVLAGSRIYVLDGVPAFLPLSRFWERGPGGEGS